MAEADVKVFLSSVIGGMEAHRAKARQAAENLGHTVTAAEDFGVSSKSPQQVCLEGVRQADVVVLLLGERYGTPQSSGLSPTHEEYREARGTKPVLVFVQMGVSPESAQENFINEASTWEGGGFRRTFDTPESLIAPVTQGLHEWELSQQAGPVDEEELADRAARLLPSRPTYSAGIPMLHLVVVGAPARQVLRPGELDDEVLLRDIEREALYGDRPVFDRSQGVQAGVEGRALVIRQANAEIALDQQGSVRISRPARDVGAGTNAAVGIPSLVEEDVRDRVAGAIHYVGWLLDRVDGVRRLSRVALASRLNGIGYMPWRTRQEVASSPNNAPVSLSGRESADSPPVVLPRAALLFEGAKHAEDITVQLRRQARR